MNYTDNFFSFPVKLYSSKIIHDTLKSEEITGQEEEIEYVIGVNRILLSSILGWTDSFSRGKSLDVIKEEGFDCTLVETSNGPSICTWKRDKFEKKVNEFANSLFEQKMKEFLNKSKEEKELDLI